MICSSALVGSRLFANHLTTKCFPKQLHFHSRCVVVSSYSSSSATLSAESEVEKKQVFDGDKAALLVRELRNNFDSGKTKSYEWRISQLEAIAKMLVEKENEIIDALQKDVSKPRLEAYITEVFQAKTSCNEALQELKHWMKPEKHYHWIQSLEPFQRVTLWF